MGCDTDSPRDVVVGRYVLRAQIGRGGMADVYEALDTSTDRLVALKRLRLDERAERNRAATELFRREFHTLTQLAHPRVVEVMDYGVDGEHPFFTMELLAGGDLHERSPLPWREACAIARDVCSALSLVHSRRMVYRDLSPRNVRCTSDRTAKLIDFGALAPMGSVHETVCTPAVAAPEVVHRQPIDGRADLYALGATLYRALVGHSPYPAKSFEQLAHAWQRRPPPPSEVVPDVPRALDVLVMDMLQLDPDLRPASAAEVSARLSALAGLEADDVIAMSQAYLTTPTLVGRVNELLSMDSCVRRLLTQSKGSAVVVRGPAGSGRTRFLDASSINAKLAGLTVLRVDPSHVPRTPLGVAQVFVEQLLDLMADDLLELARPDAAAWIELVPALERHLAAERSAAPLAPQQLSGMLRHTLQSLSARRPLLIAVDDFERLDAQSRAFVARLSHEVDKHQIVLVVTADSDAPVDTEGAHLMAASTHLGLAPLGADETHALFASIFGDVPNLHSLVTRTNALAGGLPQNLMRLAQHLLDRGVVRCEGGAWVLPKQLDPGDLPATMAQTFTQAVASLEPDARSLAQALAQSEDQRFSVEECLRLTEHGDYERLFRSIDALLSRSILTPSGSDFSLSSAAWIAPLSESLDPAIHRRIADVHLARGDALRACRHLFRLGEHAEAVRVLVDHSVESNARTTESAREYIRYLATLPRDWLQIFEEGLLRCRELGVSAREILEVQIRLSGISSSHTICTNGQQAALATTLARAVGLDVYESLDPALPAQERLQHALREAARRHDETPDHDRLPPPDEAVTMLARTVIAAVGSLARTLDLEEWRQMPSIAPLAPLSRAVTVTVRLAQSFDARVCGRMEEACEIFREVISSLEVDESQLEPTFADALRDGLAAMAGTLEAALGAASCEYWASKLEQRPFHREAALAIRLLDRIWQGDLAEADRLAKKRELWQLENPRISPADVMTELWTLLAHAASDDLTRTRQCLESVERTAARVRTWVAIAHWARGEYERIRGDFAAALTSLDAALRELPPGAHQVWPLAAGAHLKVLCEMGRFEQACATGERYMAQAREGELGYLTNYIRMPLAEAIANVGDAALARAHADAVLDGFEALGVRGLNLLLAHECAARVALRLDDVDAFAEHARACREIALVHNAPTLGAKCRRLFAAAERAQMDVTTLISPELSTTIVRSSMIAPMLDACSTTRERLLCGLQLLMGTNADRAYLYRVANGAAELCAQTGLELLPEAIDALSRRYLERALATDEDTVTWGPTEDGEPMARYRHVLLTHGEGRGTVVSGLVVLAYPEPSEEAPAAETVVELSRAIVARGDLAGHFISD